MTDGCVPEQRQSRETVLLPDDGVVALRRALYPRWLRTVTVPNSEYLGRLSPLPNDGVAAALEALWDQRISREIVPFT
jgi:hypothetical protein